MILIFSTMSSLLNSHEPNNVLWGFKFIQFQLSFLISIYKILHAKIMFAYVKGNHSKLQKADMHHKKQNSEKTFLLLHCLQHFSSTFSYIFFCKMWSSFNMTMTLYPFAHMTTWISRVHITHEYWALWDTACFCIV